jgi:non-specific protein-tyrosine kinase
MEIELKEYLAPLRKWWWLILLSTAVAGVSSYLATREQIPVYSSAATLMIGDPIASLNPSTNDLFLTQQLAQTYVNLANRSAVRNSTMEALGLDWLPEIFVRNVNNTNFIEILVNDTNPQRAQAVAAEMSRQLILSSPSSQEEDQARQRFVNEQLSDYEKAIKETQAEIEEKNALLGELISAREIADTQAEIVALQSSLRSLQSNYAALLPSSQRGATNVLREFEPASFPEFPNPQSTTTTILLAAGIGFVLAASAAYVLEYLDDTVGTSALATRLTGIPTLTGIAKIKSDDDRLITITQPRSPTAEAFRVLRTAIQFSEIEAPKRIILVTSAVPEEGKSLTSANLAIVMAQAGYKVLLVDTDLRRSSLHQFFDLPNKRGLTSILVDFSRKNLDVEIGNLVEDTIQATQVAGLQLLSAGPSPPNPSELLGSTHMRELTELLRERFDLVVFDSPPVLSVTDAVVLSTQADGVLLVVRAGLSRKDRVKQAAARLREVNANLIGSVLNVLSSRNSELGSYYYYEDSYYYTPDGSGEVGGEERETKKLRRRFWRKQVAEEPTR